MAKKITPSDVSKMLELYEKFGTYAAVAKETGFSSSTVSKYIKEQKSFKTYSTYDGPAPSEEPVQIINFSFLSQAELDSYNNFLKEFGL